MEDEELFEDEPELDEDEQEFPTLTFLVKNGRIRSKVDELPAMVQAVDKILRTERFVYPIYSDQYGSDIEELVGENMDYAKVEVERMIEEALEADERVTEVEITDLLVNQDILEVYVRVSTVYGDFSTKSEVRVTNVSE